MLTIKLTLNFVNFSGNDYSKSVDYWSLGLLCHEIGETGKIYPNIHVNMYLIIFGIYMYNIHL